MMMWCHLLFGGKPSKVPALLPQLALCSMTSIHTKTSKGEFFRARSVSVAYQMRVEAKRRNVPRPTARRIWLKLNGRQNTSAYRILDRSEPKSSPSSTTSTILNTLQSEFDRGNFNSDKLKLSSFVNSLNTSTLSNLSKKQLMCLMFCIYYCGRAPEQFLHELEKYHLESIVPSCNPAELSVIALAYFRANRPIKNYQLLNLIAQQVIKNMHKYDNPADIVNILKAFKHSDFYMTSFYHQLGEELVPKMNSVLLINASQILACYATMRCYHFNLAEAAVTSVVNLSDKELASSRLKDIAKFVWSLGTLQHFGLSTSNVLERLLSVIGNKLDRMEHDVREFPECVIDALLGCSYMGYYPRKVLEQAFSRTFIRCVRDKCISRKLEDMFLIDFSAGIELNDWNGGLVEDDIQSLSHYAFGMLDKEMNTRPGLASVTHILRQRYDKCVGVGFLLPHFKTADIFMLLDESGNPQELPEKWGNCAGRSISYVKDKLAGVTGQRIAILLYGENQFCRDASKGFHENPNDVKRYSKVDDHYKLLGVPASKVRQLQRLGFRTCVLPVDLSRNLQTTPVDQRNLKLLKSRLQSELGLNI